MFLTVLIIGLVFLVAGGIGLFITNTAGVQGGLNLIQGNITFSTFTVVGIAILVFLGIFGSEIE